MLPRLSSQSSHIRHNVLNISRLALPRYQRTVRAVPLSHDATTRGSGPLSPRTSSPFQSVGDLENADGHEQNQAEFRDGLQTVTNFYGRLFKYSALSFLALASLVFVGWEGLHQYVEWVELRNPNTDDPYEWLGDSLDHRCAICCSLQPLMNLFEPFNSIKDILDRWTGGASGGTDPRLGFRGRHALRAAWMALNWRGGDELRAQNPTVVEASEGMTPYEKQLFSTLQHLSTALNVASSLPGLDGDSSLIRDPAVVDILAQSAGILDRISTSAALATAVPMLLKIHEYYASQVCSYFSRCVGP